MAWGEQGTKITWKPTVVPEGQRKHGGWYDNPDTGFNTRWYAGGATNEAGTNNSGFDVPAPPDVSGVYNPIYEQYGRDRELAGQTKESQIGLLNEQLSSAQSVLARDKTERESYNKSQEEDLNKQLQSAYAEAIRARNANQQNAGARFGRGSSAGQAATEIADQEFYKQQGQVSQTHLRNVGAIQSDFRKYLTWSADEEQRLMQEHKAQTLQISTQYSQLLNQIASNEAMTRSEQARAVLQAQELYNARKADLNNQIQMQKMAMDQYGQKLRMDLDAQIELANRTRFDVADNTFANDVQDTIGTVQPQTQGVPMSTNYVNPFARARNSEDEFENNPYFLA